jgi:hypothetical protein
MKTSFCNSGGFLGAIMVAGVVAFSRFSDLSPIGSTVRL